MIRRGLAVAVLFAIVGCSTAHPRSKVAVLGVSLPVAGSQGGNGLMALHAIELAVDEANAASPSLHFSIELKDTARGGFVNPHEDEGRDTTLDAPNGVQDVHAFAENPGVLAIVGPMTSDVARAEIPVALRAGIALVSASARDSDLGQTPATFFRACPSRDDEARAAALAARTVGARRVFLIDAGRPARELARTFEGEFTRSRGDVVAHATLNAASFDDVMVRIDAARSDLVVFAGPEPTNMLLMRPAAARRVLRPSRLVFMENPGYMTPVGDEYYTVWEGDAPGGSASSAFSQEYRARFGVEPSLVAVYYYAAAQIVTQAIESAYRMRGQIPARAQVIAALKGRSGFATLFGKAAFDRKGQLMNVRLVIVRVVENRYEPVREVIVSRDPAND